jgi:molecular chaperone GrpE
VIRDKRRVDSTGKLRATPQPEAEGKTGQPAEPAAADAKAEPTPAATPPAEEAVEGEVIEAPDPIFDQEFADLLSKEKERAQAGQPFSAELGALRTELEDRTRDLQRISAEYANYRKRVDRDRGLAGEQATAAVIAALLPILDDLDRAREHGDLVGPFASVAEALTATLGKFGLTAFGEKGDPFDPTRHEAVAHLTSAEVTEPSCIDVMRRGYLLGDRLVRPAMVAVADPAE